MSTPMTHSCGTFATIDGAFMADVLDPEPDPGPRLPPLPGLVAALRGGAGRTAEARPRGAARAARRAREREEAAAAALVAPRRRRRRLRAAGRCGCAALRWALRALVAWIGISVILFVISSLTARACRRARSPRSRGGGLPPFSATTILVLGSDARPAGSKEPGADVGGPSRSDTMMLIRTGGGHSARLSIPRDTLVDIPGHGMGEDQRGLLLRRRRARGQDGRGLPRHHRSTTSCVVNFTNFPQLVDAMGGVTYTGSCVVSFISGGFRNGGFTLRLPSGTHHLDGAQALALARTRENHCNPHETDLTRELRQQKLLLGDEEPDALVLRLHPPAVDRLGAAADDRDRHGPADARRRAGVARAERQRAHRDPLPDRRERCRRRRRLTITDSREAGRRRARSCGS